MSWCQGVDYWIAVSPACLSWELLFLESPPLSIWRELAKGGTEREAATVTPQVVHRQADGKDWEDPQVRRPPPDCGTVAHSSPPAHGQILSNRTAKAGATQGNSLPENLHTLPFTVSQWQPEVVGYSALLPRLSTRGSWSSDHPTLPLRLQFLPLLCNALVSVINFLSPNTRDLNRTKVNENRTSQTERPLKKCS